MHQVFLSSVCRSQRPLVGSDMVVDLFTGVVGNNRGFHWTELINLPVGERPRKNPPSHGSTHLTCSGLPPPPVPGGVGRSFPVTGSRNGGRVVSWVFREEYVSFRFAAKVVHGGHVNGTTGFEVHRNGTVGRFSMTGCLVSPVHRPRVGKVLGGPRLRLKTSRETEEQVKERFQKVRPDASSLEGENTPKGGTGPV